MITDFQWLLIFFFILIYGGYIGLVCIWLILGAIINPNTFLVYATSAITFITFTIAKYQEYKTFASDGYKKVQFLVQNVFANQLKKIVGVIAAEAQSLSQPKDLAKFSIDKANDFGMAEEILQYQNIIENPLNNDNQELNTQENILNRMENWEKKMVFF